MNVQVVTLTTGELEAMLQRSATLALEKAGHGVKKYLTRKEAAGYLNISTSALDKYAIRDSIPFIQPEFSSIKLYHTTDLDEWMIANKR